MPFLSSLSLSAWVSVASVFSPAVVSAIARWPVHHSYSLLFIRNCQGGRCAVVFRNPFQAAQTIASQTLALRPEYRQTSALVLHSKPRVSRSPLRYAWSPQDRQMQSAHASLPSRSWHSV